MFLHDAYEDILTRKAEEAPGGIAPLNPPAWVSPDYDPNMPVQQFAPGELAPAQIIITAKRPAHPIPPIQLPMIQLVPTPLNPAPSPTNAWDQITARRAAMAPGASSSLTRYLPWVLGALAIAAVAMMAAGSRKSSPARRTLARPRVSYARRRRT